MGRILAVPGFQIPTEEPIEILSTNGVDTVRSSLPVLTTH